MAWGRAGKPPRGRQGQGQKEHPNWVVGGSQQPASGCCPKLFSQGARVVLFKRQKQYPPWPFVFISEWRQRGEQHRGNGSRARSQAAAQVGCNSLPCGWYSLPEPPPSQVLTLWRLCRGSRNAAKYKVLSQTLERLATALKHAVM